MLRARRPFSLGDHVLDPGDEITDEMVKLLPGHRVDLLIDQGYIERVSDTEVIAALTARVEKLEKPKPRRKVAA